MTEHDFPSPELVELETRHLAAVRATVSYSEIRALFDRAYPEIFAAIERAGARVAGPPLGVTRGEPGETFDLAAAVPVEAPFTADGEVQPETIPAGEAAALLVRGGYGRLGAAYAHLFSWIAEQGRQPADLTWEEYLTEPKPDGDPSLNETRVYALLR